jgi:hypothetical protein
MSQGCDNDYTGYHRSWPREREDEFLEMLKKAFDACKRFKSMHDINVWAVKNCIPDADLKTWGTTGDSLIMCLCSAFKGID